MTASPVTIDIDSDIKEGVPKQIICENRIPLNLSDPEPNAESLEAILEAEEILAAGGFGYSSAAEMFKAMGIGIRPGSWCCFNK